MICVFCIAYNDPDFILFDSSQKKSFGGDSKNKIEYYLFYFFSGFQKNRVGASR